MNIIETNDGSCYAYRCSTRFCTHLDHIKSQSIAYTGFGLGNLKLNYQ